MKKLFLLASVCISFLSGCCVEGEGDLWWLPVVLPGEAPTCDSLASTPYTWRYEIPATELLVAGGIAEGPADFFSTPTGYRFRNLETGGMVQEVESKIAARALASFGQPYAYGERVLFAGTTGIAVLNRKTGALEWEKVLTDGDLSGNPQGTGDAFFVIRKSTAPDGIPCHALFEGNLQNPAQLTPLPSPAYSQSFHTSWCGYGGISAFTALEAPNGHTFVLIACYEPVNATQTQNFLALFDATAGEWVYDRQPLAQSPLSVSSIALTGANTACFPYDGKIITWDIQAGRAIKAVSVDSKDGYCTPGGSKIRADENRMLLETFCSRLVLYDAKTGGLVSDLQDIPCVVRTDFALDRLFALEAGRLNIYRISTGQLIQSVIAPCEHNMPAKFNGFSYWMGQSGQLEVAVQAAGGAIYRYAEVE